MNESAIPVTFTTSAKIFIGYLCTLVVMLTGGIITGLVFLGKLIAYLAKKS